VADLTACKEKTRELAFTASPVVDSELVAMVVGPNHSNEEVMRTGLCMFQSQIAHETDIESLLEKTVQYQVTSCPLPQPANPFNSVVGQQGVQGSKAAGEPCTGSQSALPAPSLLHLPLCWGGVSSCSLRHRPRQPYSLSSFSGKAVCLKVPPDSLFGTAFQSPLKDWRNRRAGPSAELGQSGRTTNPQT